MTNPTKKNAVARKFAMALIIVSFSDPAAAAPQGVMSSEDWAQTQELYKRYSFTYPGKDLGEQLFEKEAFTSVEKSLAKALKNIRSDEGEYLYGRIISGVAADADKTQPESISKLIDRWIAHSPKSHFPFLIRGEYYVDVARYYRGTGWAKDVERENMEAHTKYLRLARTDLEKALKLNPKDPQVGANLISVAIGLNLERKTMEKYYKSALKACPHSFTARYVKMLYLMPRWHGSPEELKAFADECDAAAEKHPLLGILSAIYIRDRNKFGDEDQIGWLRNPKIWRPLQLAYLRAIESVDDPLPFHVAYVGEAFTAGRYKIAAEEFRKIGDHYASEGMWDGLLHYHIARAFSYAAKGVQLTRDAGMPLLKEAVELNVPDYYPYGRYGHVLLELGHYEEAETMLLRSMEYEVRDALPYMDLCALYEHKGEYKKSLELAQQMHDAFDYENTKRTAQALIKKYERLLAENTE